MKIYITLIFTLFTVTMYAQYTAIPDQYFEYSLIQEGLDDLQDGQVLTANINQVTELDISGFIIEDLAGIQDFIMLTALDCSENEIKSLNLSANANLKYLDCTGNQLTSLVLGNNNQLEEVWASENNLASINTSALPNLIYFLVDGNQLTSLDFSNNPNLRQLWCDYNNLNEIDLGQQNNFNELYCGSNPNLSFINIRNGNNLEMEEFDASLIQVNACIQVDDAAAATGGSTFPYDNWSKDNSSFYSENCSLGLENFVAEKVKIYPNPFHDKLNIEIPKSSKLAIIVVVDISGKIIISTTTNQLDLSVFSNGLYFIKIIYEYGNSTTQKVIKY